MIMELEGEVRRFRGLIDALEQPAIVAAEPDDLHPVALLLAQAYRLAYVGDDVETETRAMIRAAWCDITGESRYQPNQSIMEYGL